MPYLKARSLEPVEWRFFGWEIQRDAVRRNQNGIQMEGVFQVERRISGGMKITKVKKDKLYFR